MLLGVASVPLDLGVDTVDGDPKIGGPLLQLVDRPAVEVGAEELLEQGTAFLGARQQELLEPALRQQDDALELSGVEAHQFDACVGDRPGTGRDRVHGAVGVEAMQLGGGGIGGGAAPAPLGPGLLRRPADPVGTALDREGELGLARLVGPGVVRPDLGQRSPGRELAVEGEGHGIEQGGLARSGRPGDGEQAQTGERVEVDLLAAREGAEPAEAQVLRPHTATSTAATWASTDSRRTRSRSPGSSPVTSVQKPTAASSGANRRRPTGTAPPARPSTVAGSCTISTTWGKRAWRRLLASTT